MNKIPKFALTAALAGAVALAALACGSDTPPPVAPAPVAVVATPAPAATPPPPAAPAMPAAPAPAAPAPPAATAMPIPTIAPTAAPTRVPPRRIPPTATPEPEPTPEPAQEQGQGQEQEQGQEFQLPPATMTMLADGVYHYFGGSSLVVIGDEGVLITDPYNSFTAQSLLDEIAKITDLPVTTIALTHEHYDHVGGTGMFPDAEIICQWNCKSAFALDILGDVPDPDAITTFDDFLEISVGDKRVQLHYLGPGDGDATTVIYMPDERIVVTSDLYEPRALTDGSVVDDKNFVGVRHILNTISEWDIKHAVNAHSPGTDPVDMMENVAYYNDLYDAVKAAVDDALAQGGIFAMYGLFDTLPQELQLEQYQDWGNYDTSFPRHVERMLLAIYHGD